MTSYLKDIAYQTKKNLPYHKYTSPNTFDFYKGFVQINTI